MALSVKKALVDGGFPHVPHAVLQRLLFLHLARAGLGARIVRRYLLVSRFVAARSPLVVLIGGAPRSLKSTLAQALAAALNMPHVQQTDVLRALLRDRDGCVPPPLWRQGCQDTAEVLRCYRSETRAVLRAVKGDLRKAGTAGKPLIVEGLHVDPGAFLCELGVLPALAAQHAPESGTSELTVLRGRLGGDPGGPDAAAVNVMLQHACTDAPVAAPSGLYTRRQLLEMCEAYASDADADGCAAGGLRMGFGVRAPAEPSAGERVSAWLDNDHAVFAPSGEAAGMSGGSGAGAAPQPGMHACLQTNPEGPCCRDSPFMRR